MTNPTVCAVMLVDGRREMVRRAVESFRAQTYENKRLVMLATGKEQPEYFFDYHPIGEDALLTRIYTGYAPELNGHTIGFLRNRVNELASAVKPDILMHWDSDDWSAPERMEDQVGLLTGNDAECVGYGSMLFWHEGKREAWRYRSGVPDYCLGTSLCYWRSVWESRPFADEPKLSPDGQLIGIAEDLLWQQRVKIRSAESCGISNVGAYMIASIHGGNTLSRIQADCREWTRVPQWDSFCRNRMEIPCNEK